VSWSENDQVFDQSGISILPTKLPAAEIITLPATERLPMMEHSTAPAAAYRTFLQLPVH